MLGSSSAEASGVEFSGVGFSNAGVSGAGSLGAPPSITCLLGFKSCSLQ